MGELLQHGETMVLLKGGKGGRGNLHFKSSTNRAPREFEQGLPGERGEFLFLLKTIADVGLVGFPNAGKSTLTGMITKARPKTASYPFTTLFPSVGVIDFPEHHSRLKLADIPGLIQGAHENKGLGHRFLRHIERTTVLALIVDMAAVDGRDPRKDYRHLLRELECYSPELLDKPRIVIANKMDEANATEWLRKFKRSVKTEIIPVSCLLGEGLELLKQRFWQSVHGLI